LVTAVVLVLALVLGRVGTLAATNVMVQILQVIFDQLVGRTILFVELRKSIG